MKYDFCTVTDKNFVYKCIALCNSIEKYISNSKIWILCLDEESENLIKKLEIQNTETISVSNLNDPELEKTRLTRTKQEFAWTCKPNFMNYLLQIKKVNTLIFTDSDLLFYNSIESVLEKYKNASILITSHKFSKKKEYLAPVVGYYNSGFIIFRNNETSRACTKKYKDQCIDWCFNYHDKGRHGDQSYLKTWPSEFKNVEEIVEKGVNLGTWNLEQYKVRKENDSIYIDNEKLICYHFHGFKAYLSGNGIIKPYPVTVHNRNIYKIYIDELERAYKQILAVEPAWTYGFAPKLSILRIIKQTVTQIFRSLCQ